MHRTHQTFASLVAVSLFAIAAFAPLTGRADVPASAEKSWAKVEPLNIDKAALAELDAIVNGHIAEKIYPGAVVVVGRPGEILWQKAYGRMTYDPASAPITLDTLFDMASCSKVIGTATMTMHLIDNGKMGLNDPVSKYIPEFASEGKDEVTIKDLLTHVSGLKAYEQVAKIKATQKDGETSDTALVRHIALLPTQYKPRTDYVYSCLNFLTLAGINQKVAGETQESYLRKYVWTPLQMKNSMYYVPANRVKDCAPTIQRASGDFAGKVHDPLANFSETEKYCPGNAGLFSTGPDVAQWCQMILSGGQSPAGQIFKPETIAAMTIKQTPEAVTSTRGLGFDIWDDAPYSLPQNKTDDALTIGHTGYTGTLFWMDKKTKLFIVHLTNRVYPDDKQSVSGARRDVISAVLKAYPEYRDTLASIQKERSERRGSTPQ